MNKPSGINITILQEDIDRAIKNVSSRCVVAQAIMRSVPNSKRVEVDMQTIRWTQNDQRYVWITPYRVQDYIIAFDAGDTIEPFAFKLYYSKRVTTPMIKRNAAAKKVQSAEAKVRTRKAKVKETTKQLADAKKSNEPQVKIDRLDAQVKTATALVNEATSELVETKKVEKPHAKSKLVGGERPLPMKRATSTPNRRNNKRHYGRKDMRVNQQPEAETAKS